MNRRPSGLKLDKAIPGFLQYKAAEGLSPRTVVPQLMCDNSCRGSPTTRRLPRVDMTS
jgi:hypothetical protein